MDEAARRAGAARVILALDNLALGEMARWAKELEGSAGFFKIGLACLYASLARGVSLGSFFGEAGGRGGAARGGRIFVDAKLYDIPNVVGRAAAEISAMGAEFLTVHSGGGRVAAARRAVGARGAAGAKILAVTVLTSEAAGIDEVCRLAEGAMAEGADGVVASAREARALRKILGEEALIVAPGIRPVSYGGGDDQKRVATPREAIEAGADYLVIGRPILGAEDPRRAAEEIIAEIAAAL